MNASHSLNLITNSCHHISTNGKPANTDFLSRSYVRPRTRFDLTCSQFGRTKKREYIFLYFTSTEEPGQHDRSDLTIASQNLKFAGQMSDELR